MNTTQEKTYLYVKCEKYQYEKLNEIFGKASIESAWDNDGAGIQGFILDEKHLAAVEIIKKHTPIEYDTLDLPYQTIDELKVALGTQKLSDLLYEINETQEVLGLKDFTPEMLLKKDMREKLEATEQGKKLLGMTERYLKKQQYLTNIKGKATMQKVLPAILADLETLPHKQAQSAQGTTKEILTADKLIDDQEQRLAQYRGKEFIGLPQKTLPKLDELLLGLRKLILLAAAPNVGKTALTIQLGIDTIKNNPDTCLVYASFEMSREEIFDRMRCSLTPMSYNKLYFGTIKDGGDRGWYTEAEKKLLEASKKEIEKIGNRILILDEDCMLDTDTDGIMAQVDKLKDKANCKRVIVIIDYLQVLPISEDAAKNLHSDIAIDKYRIAQMKKLRRALGNDPLIVIAEARKPSGDSLWATSIADILGSSRTAYGIDAGILLNPLSDEQLAKGLNKDKIGDAIRNALSKKGMAILNLTIDKGRDGMEKGTILLAYYFRENRFVETNWDDIASAYIGVLAEFPNMEKTQGANGANQNSSKRSTHQQSLGEYANIAQGG